MNEKPTTVTVTKINTPSHIRLWKLRSGKTDFVDINIRFKFVEDDEWKIIVDQHLIDYENFYHNNWEEKDKMTTYARGLESKNGIIYIKKSARDDDDFQWLILHELGHAISDLGHSKLEGSIMHSHYKQWNKYKNWSEQE